ncbi:hypothetical protein D1640_02270 [Muribaculaceae bacterium S4]|nr:hypothetical protein [Muribaculaceae bacterium S4]
MSNNNDEPGEFFLPGSSDVLGQLCPEVSLRTHGLQYIHIYTLATISYLLLPKPFIRIKKQYNRL